MSPIYSQFQQHLDTLIKSALKAVAPERAVRRYLQYDRSRIQVSGENFDVGNGSVYLVGVGKASIKMGLEASEILDGVIKKGILISKDVDDPPRLTLPDSIELFLASHPVSDIRGVEATNAIVEMLADTTENDYVICLISGGASALLTRPIIPLADWQLLVNALLESGCSINELNSVRRQIDTVKGGGLLEYTAPAECISLILSDVVGNPLEVIGSGPTIRFDDKPEAARLVLKRYSIHEVLPDGVWNRVDQALRAIEENEPAKVDPAHNYIIGDVRQAAMAAESAAAELGLSTQLLTCHLEGEAREVGKVAASMARDLEPGSSLLLGGETTVTVRGDGLGGRNQELALSAAIALDGVDNVVVASFATDGEDGPTKAAGAYATGSTCQRARDAGLDPQEFLNNNDSNTFFSQVGGLLNSGSTGTNVNDLLFIIKYDL